MSAEKADLSQFEWVNPPERPVLTGDGVEFSTSPNTDFWQRTHYGFRRASGHAFLARFWNDFSFSARTEFFYETLFDQAGLLLYIDEDNWAKVSLEYEDDTYGLLGSVVTNAGYSDWASTPVDFEPNRMFYRLSRRGGDFRFDCSGDGVAYRQMRVFHMHGDLSLARAGIYAASPGDAGFKVRFADLRIGASVWKE